jgi:MoxR-like ATPase
MHQSKSSSFLTRMGVIGMTPIEPVIFAALITAEPLLLIGPHGTGKSLLLNRISAVLGLESRHYNASLLNFDDLVGYPLPNGKGQIEYVRTPAAIWGAQTIFLDEISRCRPDMQNKLFPIIHERRVQGIELKDLVYRWAAMNPPSNDEDANQAYLGSEPLDAALADRFAFVVEVPSWEQLSDEEQGLVIRSRGTEADIVPDPKLAGEIANGRRVRKLLETDHTDGIVIYVRLLIALLAQAGLQLSPRRAGMILRNVLAVHAANSVLGFNVALQDSALLAVRSSLPQLAQGIKVDQVKVLAAHREAWKASQLEEGDPSLSILTERDPVRRVMKASVAESISASDFSSIVADALAALPPGGRHALAFSLLESAAASRLVAAVAEQCAELYAIASTAHQVLERVSAKCVRHRVWQRIVKILAQLAPDLEATVLKTNLLCGLFTSNQLAVEEDADRAVEAWEQVHSELWLPGQQERSKAA